MTMGDLTQRVLAKLTRRRSINSSRSSLKSVESTQKRRGGTRDENKKPASTFRGRTIDEKDEGRVDVPGSKIQKLDHQATGSNDRHPIQQQQLLPEQQKPDDQQHLDVISLPYLRHDSTSTADFPTPNTELGTLLGEAVEDSQQQKQIREDSELLQHQAAEIEFSIVSPSPGSIKPEFSRRQSLLPPKQARLIKTLLETELSQQGNTATADYFTEQGPSTISGNMVMRKIWVKRPGASATLVSIHEDDLVDDVRDMILKKYANSLGRSFDAPDVTLRVVPRENTRQERTLGPEEPMARLLDAYFPGGQTVEEALVIDVPLRRTPKPSPRPNVGGYYDHDERRPQEASTDYFPPMPVVSAASSPHLSNAGLANVRPGSHHSPLITHSMSVLTTGNIPNLPSPGVSGTRRHNTSRPRVGRTHTSSPTVVAGQSQLSNGMQAYPVRTPHLRTHSSASENSISPPPTAPPLPTPPVQPLDFSIVHRTTPQTQTAKSQQRKKSKRSNEHPNLPAGMLNAAVPPINVLIVEDNIINLKLLEAFMKRLKVRWQTAMDGKQAVAKWKTGGFHLVLMDIQLPVMSGLEATREIRRLERLNSIGVFSSASNDSGEGEVDMTEPKGDDKLSSTLLFKSPVIIVALTASSLQSDRHEALAAGCNDFLTKPVNFVWLERKVMEWGCMQALIDFDGWRKWKDFSQKGVDASAGEQKKTAPAKKQKNRASAGLNSGASTSRVDLVNEEEDEGDTGV
ncbi:putative two-component response regulator SSK1p [Calycina marina]|uniref:Two-component response regulator SSK1p n=1 Tax=Calycina marina TaxID=1763456 RepID=A0A9P7YZ58_9HELO|nr:putative two-component response regulator SSK1p [Calycina marina]